MVKELAASLNREEEDVIGLQTSRMPENDGAPWGMSEHI